MTNKNCKILSFIVGRNGNFPNNAFLPVIIYEQVFTEIDENRIKECLAKNEWGNSWVNGIYDVHHYHSTAHEVLVCIAGSCSIQIGGPGGKIIAFNTGDAIVLPAGTAHKNEGSSNDFQCLGAYANKQTYDLLYGKEEEYAAADANIQRTIIASHDPFFGAEGILKQHWKQIGYDGS